MDKVRAGVTGARARGRRARIGLALIVVALYGAAGCGVQSSGEAKLKQLAVGEMAKLEVSKLATDPDPIKADSPDGKPVTLADFKGEVVVVNLWATWCAPCVKEMPTLAALQTEFAGKPVKVVAISLDRGAEDMAKARAFIAGKPPLGFYHGEYDMAFALKPAVEGLPVTLLYDSDGHERARLSGGADWSGAQAKAVIDQLLATPG